MAIFNQRLAIAIICFFVFSFLAMAAPSSPNISDLLEKYGCLDPQPEIEEWSSASSDPCSEKPWRGVTCSGQHVVSIDIEELSLDGFLCSHLATLLSLNKLNLSFNNFTGGLPSSFGSLTTPVTMNPLSLSDGKEIATRHYHMVNVTDMLPQEICATSSDAHHPGMELIDRHGPCVMADRSEDKMTHLQILNQDQFRVGWIQNRKTNNSRRSTLSSSVIPVSQGSNYIVKVSFGTPSVRQTLLIDTGNSITWIQCKPCRKCYDQIETLFDPTKSSTYQSLRSDSFNCLSEIGMQTGNKPDCRYIVRYLDNSYSRGKYGSDTLNLSFTRDSRDDLIWSFRFGCGNKSIGNHDKHAAGLLGLARERASIVIQTKSLYDKVFYYCVPPTRSSIGHLRFGRDLLPTNVRYTTMLAHDGDQDFYFVEVMAISVGGKKLKINRKLFLKAGTIVDSGTVITWLPPTVYKELREEFKSQMMRYPRTEGIDLLDTCYDLSQYSGAVVPSVVLKFRNVKMDLDPSGILYVVGRRQSCLAFTENEKDNKNVIIGSTQQMRFNIVYDLKNLQVGFGPQGC